MIEIYKQDILLKTHYLDARSIYLVGFYIDSKMNISEKSSIYYGVFLYKKGVYKCVLSVSRNKILIGYNSDPLILAKLYDNKVIELGLKRRLNFPVYPENLIPNTKLIQLTQGKFAIVDECDFERVNQFKWCAHSDGTNWYAIKRNYIGDDSVIESMHKFIIGCILDGLEVDHANGNSLDNSSTNLRPCTHAENGRNLRCRIGCSSIYKGVSWNKEASKWSAIIVKNYKRIHREYFDSEIDAAKQYDIWAKELFGEFARLNFPE